MFWMSFMTWAKYKPFSRAFRILSSCQRTNIRSTQVSTWPSGRISVWVIPSVFSYTYFPLEVKAECFHLRFFEGVALSSVIIPLQVNHPHLLLCVCIFHVKIVSLWCPMPIFQLMWNFSYIFNFYKQVYFIMKKQVKVKITWIQSRFLSPGLLFFNLHTPLDHLSQLHCLNNHLSAHCLTFFSLPLTALSADEHTIPSASWASSPGLITGSVLCPNLISLLLPYKLFPSIFIILVCGTNIYPPV